MTWNPNRRTPNPMSAPVAARGTGDTDTGSGVHPALANYRAGLTRQANMGPGMRLGASLAGPLGWSTFTPDQAWWRSTLGSGRWGGKLITAPGENANRPMNMIRRTDDGCCDVVALEASGKFVFDLGGRGATDVRAGRV